MKAKEQAAIHTYPDVYVSRGALGKLDGFEEELKGFISKLIPIAERPQNPTNIDEIWLFTAKTGGKINHTKEDWVKLGDDGKNDDFKDAIKGIESGESVSTKETSDSISYTQKCSISKDTEYKIVVGGSDWVIFAGGASVGDFKKIDKAFKIRRNVNA